MKKILQLKILWKNKNNTLMYQKNNISKKFHEQITQIVKLRVISQTSNVKLIKQKPVNTICSLLCLKTFTINFQKLPICIFYQLDFCKWFLKSLTLKAIQRFGSFYTFYLTFFFNVYLIFCYVFIKRNSNFSNLLK